MNTVTHATDGARVAVTVDFVSRRRIDTPAGAVTRLLVRYREDDEIAILVPPGSGAYPGLATGQRYLVEGLLVAEPPSGVDTDRGPCPDCGGDLRPGVVLDCVDPALAQARSALGIDGTVGIADDGTAIRRYGWGDDDDRDDESPRRDFRSHPSPPDLVCRACDGEFAAGERGDGDADDAVGPRSGSDEENASGESRRAGGRWNAETASGDFRARIMAGAVPSPAAIDVRSLFAEYGIDPRGVPPESDAPVLPRFGVASVEHPITGSDEVHLAVKLQVQGFPERYQRQPLDLVVVCDLSEPRVDWSAAGATGDGPRDWSEAPPDRPTHVSLPPVLTTLSRKLREDDRLGVVTVDRDGRPEHPRQWGYNLPDRVKSASGVELGCRGATTTVDGLRTAIETLGAESPAPRERRVLLLTDALPPAGQEFLTEVTEAAAGGIHTTVVGIGSAETADFAESFSRIRGANAWDVPSQRALDNHLRAGVNPLVAPLVHDLTVDLATEGFEIDSIHGAPSAEPGIGQLQYLGTVFPPIEGPRPGPPTVLVTLGNASERGACRLALSWTDPRTGARVDDVEMSVPMDTDCPDVRTAVALVRYARELKAWARDVRGQATHTETACESSTCHHHAQNSGHRVPLRVPDWYTDRLHRLQGYLRMEMAAIEEPRLQREIAVLDRLQSARGAPESEVAH